MCNLTQAEATWRKTETQRPQLTVTLGFDVMYLGRSFGVSPNG